MRRVQSKWSWLWLAMPWPGRESSRDGLPRPVRCVGVSLLRGAALIRFAMVVYVSGIASSVSRAGGGAGVTQLSLRHPAITVEYLSQRCSFDGAQPQAGFSCWRTSRWSPIHSAVRDVGLRPVVSGADSNCLRAEAYPPLCCRAICRRDREYLGAGMTFVASGVSGVTLSQRQRRRHSGVAACSCAQGGMDVQFFVDECGNHRPVNLLHDR